MKIKKPKSLWRMIIFEGLIKVGLGVCLPIYLLHYLSIEFINNYLCRANDSFSRNCDFFNQLLPLAKALPMVTLILLTGGALAGAAMWFRDNQEK